MSIALHPSAPFRQIGSGENVVALYSRRTPEAAADIGKLAG
jgi:hypothetical protein